MKKIKEFHFTKTYFNKLLYEDKESKIRIEVNEIPSLDITEENYSLRVKTRHEEDRPIHRKYAIEHHQEQAKHNYPHLQFKFHTEEIGTFWIRLYLNTPAEYKKAILGFIYKTKEVLENLEQCKEGITKEILVLDLVNKLSQEGDFLTQKITEGLTNYQIEFQKQNKVQTLKTNPLLTQFLGHTNVQKLSESYQNQLRKKK